MRERRRGCRARRRVARADARRRARLVAVEAAERAVEVQVGGVEEAEAGHGAPVLRGRPAARAPAGMARSPLFNPSRPRRQCPRRGRGVSGGRTGPRRPGTSSPGRSGPRPAPGWRGPGGRAARRPAAAAGDAAAMPSGVPVAATRCGRFSGASITPTSPTSVEATGSPVAMASRIEKGICSVVEDRAKTSSAAVGRGRVRDRAREEDRALDAELPRERLQRGALLAVADDREAERHALAEEHRGGARSGARCSSRPAARRRCRRAAPRPAPAAARRARPAGSAPMSSPFGMWCRRARGQAPEVGGGAQQGLGGQHDGAPPQQHPPRDDAARLLPRALLGPEAVLGVDVAEAGQQPGRPSPIPCCPSCSSRASPAASGGAGPRSARRPSAPSPWRRAREPSPAAPRARGGPRNPRAPSSETTAWRQRGPKRFATAAEAHLGAAHREGREDVEQQRRVRPRGGPAHAAEAGTTRPAAPGPVARSSSASAATRRALPVQVRSRRSTSARAAAPRRARSAGSAARRAIASHRLPSRRGVEEQGGPPVLQDLPQVGLVGRHDRAAGRHVLEDLQRRGVGHGRGLRARCRSRATRPGIASRVRHAVEDDAVGDAERRRLRLEPRPRRAVARRRAAPAPARPARSRGRRRPCPSRAIPG